MLGVKRTLLVNAEVVGSARALKAACLKEILGMPLISNWSREQSDFTTPRCRLQVLTSCWMIVFFFESLLLDFCLFWR